MKKCIHQIAIAKNEVQTAFKHGYLCTCQTCASIIVVFITSTYIPLNSMLQLIKKHLTCGTILSYSLTSYVICYLKGFCQFLTVCFPKQEI